MATSEPERIMAEFARRTGLTGEAPQRRYLWTDAFAVQNLLALGRPEEAIRLVDAVHHTLGRHRADDRRKGWISGLSEPEGEAHPTAGGLRIGKELPERGADDPYDDELEWSRDGQYLHYLTRWMDALEHVARATRDAHYNRWGRELAAAAYRGFSYRNRLAWKMGIDLSRPLVTSMGHHDALDGYVTCVELRATASSEGPSLDAELARYRRLMEGTDWTTRDLLGIGGLLIAADRLETSDGCGRVVRRPGT